MAKNFQFLIYRSALEDVTVEAVIKDETIWLTQKAMASLFDVDRSVIAKHLINIFSESELDKDSTCAKIAQVQIEGVRQVERLVDFYNLDAIISVGYRVNSKRATNFRIWATSTLKEYMTKGFVLDDERLKQGKTAFGEDYFKELLERIRSIRASERRIWLQLTDIFAELSIDYDPKSKETQCFYADIQNKFHYAITGKTAAEIVNDSADHNKENMGLKTWKNSPNGRILKSDVDIAKNYLSESEIKRLEREVSSFFDHVERLIERRNVFEMKDFARSIESFLTFNEYKVLPDHGSITAKQAKEKAYAEYDIFNKTQKINSDFDKELKKMLDSNTKE